MGGGRIFGGAKLDQINKGDKQLTFKDIEGIDQVKTEIRELVEFLKNPKRFIDLGARSPAGVLLVGAPGTGMPLHLHCIWVAQLNQRAVAVTESCCKKTSIACLMTVHERRELHQGADVSFSGGRGLQV